MNTSAKYGHPSQKDLPLTLPINPWDYTTSACSSAEASSLSFVPVYTSFARTYACSICFSVISDINFNLVLNLLRTNVPAIFDSTDILSSTRNQAAYFIIFWLYQNSSISLITIWLNGSLLSFGNSSHSSSVRDIRILEGTGSEPTPKTLGIMKSASVYGKNPDPT